MDTVKGKDDHEGAEHGYCATRPDHTATHRQIARTTLYIYNLMHSNYTNA